MKKNTINKTTLMVKRAFKCLRGRFRLTFCTPGQPLEFLSADSTKDPIDNKYTLVNNEIKGKKEEEGRI